METPSHRLRLLVIVVTGRKCANYIKLVATKLRAPDRGYLSRVNAPATPHWDGAKGNIEGPTPSPRSVLVPHIHFSAAHSVNPENAAGGLLCDFVNCAPKLRYVRRAA